MRSSQVRFFMSEQDEKGFLDAVERCGPFVIIETISHSERVREVELPLPPERRASLSQILLARSTDPENFVPIRSRHKSLWVIDKIRSHVIEWSRSQVSTHGRHPVRIADGRIWFCLDDGYGNYKESEFCEWARSVARISKRFLSCYTDGYWIAPHARATFERGQAEMVFQ